jgi:hypothetical protein
MPSIPPFRGAAYALIATVVLIWVMCALGSNLGVAEFPTSTITKSRVNLDIWYQCQRSTNTAAGVSSVANCISTTDSANPCGEWKGRLRAVQAFYIFTIMTTIVAIILGFLTQVQLLPALPFGLSHKILLIAVAGLLVFWSLLSWAVAISVVTEDFCKKETYAIPKFKDVTGFKWGASPFFMLIGFFCAIVMIVAVILIPQSGEHEPVAVGEVVDHGEANAEARQAPGEKQAWGGAEA